MVFILAAACLCLFTLPSSGLPLDSFHTLDEVIRLQLLAFSQSGSISDGIVLASTIVEGGPVFGRRRRILGGKTVDSSFKFVDFHRELDRCPKYVYGHHCQIMVSPECLVIRHLLVNSKLCLCHVNVC